MVCTNDQIQSKGQGHRPCKMGHTAIFKSYLLCHLQWELATDREFLNYGTISKFDWAGYIIWPSFCVTWLPSWQKRQFWRVDRQSSTGLIYHSMFIRTTT